LIKVYIKMNKKLKKIPNFKDEDEERDFWATHDSTDYFDWSKARHVTFPNLQLTKGPTSLKYMSRYVVKVIEFKGQLCVPFPKKLIKELGWKEGDSINVEYDKKRNCVVMTKV